MPFRLKRKRAPHAKAPCANFKQLSKDAEPVDNTRRPFEVRRVQNPCECIRQIGCARDSLGRANGRSACDQLHKSLGASQKVVPENEPIPDILLVSPVSLVCPYCGPKPGEDCATSRGGLAVLHLARINAAARRDTAA
jgi:hypothetical protein